ncbi:MAG: hypothetical protein ACRERX_01925 [Pseudomonas sp.]
MVIGIGVDILHLVSLSRATLTQADFVLAVSGARLNKTELKAIAVRGWIAMQRNSHFTDVFSCLA